MGKPTIRMTIALILCSLSAAAVASADTMTITYRSGKVQKVALDEPSAEVQGISYLRTSEPLSEIKVKEQSMHPAETQDSIGKKTARDLKKPGVSIKWAPPIDQ